MRLPRPGDVLRLTRRASVQFLKPINVRVIHVHEDWPVSMGRELGWLWLDVYELDEGGDAVERRSVFVDVTAVDYGAPRPVGSAPDLLAS